MNEILIIFFTLLSAVLFPVLASILLRKKLGHEHLAKHNDVAGFIFAIVGVIYAVLMAFVVIVVWEEHQETNQIVEQEANTISSMIALSDALDEPYKSEIKVNIKNYLHDIVFEDWKLMEKDLILNKDIVKVSDKSFGNLRTKIFSYRTEKDYEQRFLEMMTKNVEELASDRRMRFFATSYVVPQFMWFVLIFGAIIVISYSLLFSTENLWAQIVMISFLSLSIALVLLLIHAMNHPYIGIVKVTPESFNILLESLK